MQLIEVRDAELIQAITNTSCVLPAEMTATGEIVDGTVHVHAVMAVEGDRVISGHLHRADIATHFSRAYLVPVAPGGPVTQQQPE